MFCFRLGKKNEFIIVKVYHIMAKIYSSYFRNKTIRRMQRDWSGIVKETRRIESFILQKVHGLNEDLVNYFWHNIGTINQTKGLANSPFKMKTMPNPFHSFSLFIPLEYVKIRFYHSCLLPIDNINSHLQSTPNETIYQ